jgi:hypothetical protein
VTVVTDKIGTVFGQRRTSYGLGTAKSGGDVKQVNIAICTQIGVPVETYGKFPSYLARRAGVLQFPVLAIAAKHSFSLAAMCASSPNSANNDRPEAVSNCATGESPLS